jgi:calcineurin-like phosphoesterase family protein
MALEGLYEPFQKWGEKNAVWLISDTHFGDKELQKAQPRPISDDELVNSINCKVGRTGTLVHLGDVGDLEYVRKLKGYKVLIAGNHDTGLEKYKKVIEKRIISRTKFPTKEEIVKYLQDTYPNCKYDISEYSDFIPSWCVLIDNCLFDEVYSGPLFIGQKLLLSHEPIHLDCAYNIHGHDHIGFPRVNHLNVCVDVVKGEPVSLNKFLKSGFSSKVFSIHRETINNATIRKRKREKKSKNV